MYSVIELTCYIDIRLTSIRLPFCIIEYWDSEIYRFRVKTGAIIFVIANSVTDVRLPSASQPAFNQAEGLMLYYRCSMVRPQSAKGYILAYSLNGVLTVCHLHEQIHVEGGEDNREHV